VTKALLFGGALLIAQITGSPETDAKLMADALAHNLKQCSARVVVAKYKSGWQKNAWGPPADVDYDVLTTSSLLWPYQLVISYTLPISMTKNYKKKEDAEQDSKADLVIRTKYKNIYELGDKGVRISALLGQQLNGEWHERSTAFDACWDNLPSSSANEGKR
jgi:hypothetical protein